MNKLERYFMLGIIRREVTQGYDHTKRISALYGLIRSACENEFTEDSALTLNAFLSELFEHSQWHKEKP